MALSKDPDKQYDEIQSAEKFRNFHIKELDTLNRRMYGNYYRHDRHPDGPMAINHAYEYLTIMLPQISYGTPRVRVTSKSKRRRADPMLASAVVAETTPADIAEGLKFALNDWARDDRLEMTMLRFATDYFFFMSICLISIEDQPGYNGWETLVPQRPFAMRISHWHYGVDPTAKAFDVMAHDGPRYKFHSWKADHEDLLDDPEYDSDAVKQLVTDTDIDKFNWGGEESSEHFSPPKRKEIIAYDVWVPEHRDDNEDGDHGTIYTVAKGQSAEGQTKRIRGIRKPRPYHGPPWGPYIEAGFLCIPDHLYPLSPMIATAEVAEEVNSHHVAMSEDAATYKRNVLVDAASREDGQAIRNGKHGEYLVVKNPEAAREVETGGIARVSAEIIPALKMRLDHMSGLPEAVAGAVQKGVTATADQLAASGMNARTSGLQKNFRWFTREMFKTASWFMYHDEDQIYSGLGDEAERAGILEFRGGAFPGQENFSWYDNKIDIEPWSLEHTDNAIIQKRMLEAFQLMGQTAPLMLQAPFIDWKEMLNRLFDQMNMGSAEELIIQPMLDQMMGMEMGAMEQSGQPPSFSMSNPQAVSKGIEQEGPATQAARMTGAERSGALQAT